ncbi:acyl-CoA dehydrogenase family protein, partial [Parapedobacter sp.]
MGPYNAPDYYLLDELISDEHLLIRDSVRQWVNNELVPVIEGHAQRAEFPEQLLPGMARLGLFGPTIPEAYGGAGLDYLAYGLMMQELERGDSGIRSTASVQGSLVMYPIYTYGSEAQKQRYLPKLASGELIGCFGLTEPNYGSDPGSMITRFEDEGDTVLLNGSKMWISNAPFADIAVVWAKNPEGQVQGLLVERGMEGFSTPETHNKWSLRASATGELVFDNVHVPKSNILPDVTGMRGPLSCLNQARYGIAWGALGAAMECYDTALRYAQEREQFGKPIAAFQLQQKKLAEMITEITKGQLLVWRLAQLKNEDRATPAQISMAKRNNVATALHVAREARQVLGA